MNEELIMICRKLFEEIRDCSGYIGYTSIAMHRMQKAAIAGITAIDLALKENSLKED